MLAFDPLRTKERARERPCIAVKINAYCFLQLTTTLSNSNNSLITNFALLYTILMPSFDNDKFVKRVIEALQQSGRTYNETRIMTLIEARDQLVDSGKYNPQTALYEAARSQGFTNDDIATIDAAEERYLADLGLISDTQPAAPRSTLGSYTKDVLILLGIVCLMIAIAYFFAT
ncbi:MAG: hypothetical protein WAU02_01850 [Candidatus Saccharimonadales bacterium]